MTIQIVYDSNHGKTKSVVNQFVFVKNKADEDFKIWADIVLFMCPTYGDEELPHAMEDFLTNLTVENKSYVICELGNYYGYDDFEFGSKKIIEYNLKNLKWTKFYKGLSLDSMPNVDWKTFNKWKEGLENALQDTSL